MTDLGISIVVLTLNGEQHIKRLLHTFFKTNTYTPVEFIIIDHGSTDNTFEVISRYATKTFIRLIKRRRNYSFAGSCNFGASKARYPYLLFMNNDILFTSDVLPAAVAKITNKKIGAIGVRLDDDPASLPQGETPRIQHSGVTFVWDEEKGFHRPVQIRHDTVEEAVNLGSGYYPAVTGAFMLCRRKDFNALHGFCEDYDYGFEDIDFCLKLAMRLNKQCWCINELSLLHVDAASRKLSPKAVQRSRRQKNDAVFKKRMGCYAQQVSSRNPAITVKDSPKDPPQRNERAFSVQLQAADRVQSPSLNILFVLYDSINSNGGFHVRLFSERLNAMGADCRVAVPVNKLDADRNDRLEGRIHTFSKIVEDGPGFSNGHSPDIIHAWTPREKVRKFSETMREKYRCPLVVHLEDNEEYLTEVTVGLPFKDLKQMQEGQLDRLIPDNRYHPIKGRRFLSSAQGLTMIIDTLAHFNGDKAPSMVLPPPVDEKLFYPRPLNIALRKELNIPDNHLVLAYTGNAHAANRDEVRELYQAVFLLNQQGQPTTLIRTGVNAVDIGDEPWITAHEKNLGWVERYKIAEILAAANVLVQPGAPGRFNDHRIPCKLPEYFAMGRPVILPRSNLGLKVKHGVDAYVLDQANGESISKAVIKINENQTLAGRLAAGGRAFEQTRLLMNTTEKMLSFYLEISKK